ncbi:MerR family transcriptional regulator [Bacillus fonticola]|uniref:MerR family transcriptional regulator n=1 Tax=Bacillus fonticola TaxID=2728853 RepID=UPI001474096B|nr:MerR family transcriptional regulator [Bacillus fonticola]
MSSKEIRKSMPLFPISIVMKLTDLSARQIRYYEEHGLVAPARSQGGKRLFSYQDLDILLEVKDLLDQGVNLAGVKAVFKQRTDQMKAHVMPHAETKKDLSDRDLRKYLRQEMMDPSRPRGTLRQGDLSRFFH